MLSFKIIFGCLALYHSRSFALPSIQFPVDAQLPPVAVVGQPFSFTFSPTTFSSSLNLDYSTTGLPAWLQFEAFNRTVNGVPAQRDVGDLEFELIAVDRDGQAVTKVHLIVLEEILVRSDQDVFARELAELGNLSAPSTLLLYPETSFSLAFGPDIFKSSGAKLEYYAKAEDHTPLPAWAMFNEDSIRFSGISPALLTPQSSPQTFNFCLIASQISGFSQSVLYFEIAVTNHMLFFENAFQTFNISAGTIVSISPLIDQLRIDGKPAQRAQLIDVSSTQPNWLIFEQDDLSFHGIAPTGVNSTTFRLQVIDDTNNIAIVDVDLTSSDSDPESVTDIDLGSLTVSTGQWFSHTLINTSSVSHGSNVEINVDFGLPVSWLTFQQTNTSIQGLVPTTAENDNLEISATITHNGQVVERCYLTLLFINVQQATGGQNMDSGTETAQPNQTASNEAAAEPTGPRNQLQKRHLALVIALPVVFTLSLCLAVILLVRKLQNQRARRSSAQQSASESMQAPSLNDLVIVAGSDSHSESETWPRSPMLQPQLTIPWIHNRPPTREMWPLVGNRSSVRPQIRSTWDEMLRQTESSHSQSSHDESRQTRDGASEHTDIIVDRSSSQFDTDDDNVPEDLLMSLGIPDGDFANQQRSSNIASSNAFNGRGPSGLGFRRRASSSVPHSKRATLRQVSLSPTSGFQTTIRDTGKLDLIDAPFLSRFRKNPDMKETMTRAGSNFRCHAERSFSAGNLGHNEYKEDQFRQTNQHMRKRTSSTPFSGSLWEGEDSIIENSASKMGNWHAQGPSYLTSLVSTRFCREESAVRGWNDEMVRSEAGVVSNAVSMRSQQTDGSHSNSLRFI